MSGDNATAWFMWYKEGTTHPFLFTPDESVSRDMHHKWRWLQCAYCDLEVPHMQQHCRCAEFFADSGLAPEK